MGRINGHEETIGNVFSDKYAFTIPPYQRPYSWEIDQANELIDDLITAQAEGLSGPDPTPYFLGSIVLIKKEDESESEVIDGQQRLTTLSLLLSALRFLLPEKNAKVIEEMLLEEGNEIKGTKDRFRLTLRTRDRDFFRDQILKASGIDDLKTSQEKLTDPQARLRQNAILLHDRLEKLCEEERANLAKYIVQHTFLIVVSTPDLSSAFRIFSVLNDRGMDLSVADILKAEIVGAISEAEQAAYTDKWEEAEESLGTRDFADLFPHIRMIHAKKKARSTILNEFREHVKAVARPKAFIDGELIPYGDAMVEILGSRYESAADASQLNRYFAYLRRIGDRDWLPPALLFLARKHKDLDALLRFFKDLERLAMGLWLMRMTVNERIDRYALIIEVIESEGDLYGEGSPLQLTNEEQDNIVSVLDGNIYQISPAAKRLPILLRLDEALSSGEANYNLAYTSVEHILPQNPPEDSEWIKWWPDQEKREANVHRLGNLALLNRRQNSAARNFEFETKKLKYFFGKDGSSPFQLTTRLANEGQWTIEEFKKIQKEYVAKLREIWRLRNNPFKV
jgi:hypothetical protein